MSAEVVSQPSPPRVADVVPPAPVMIMVAPTGSKSMKKDNAAIPISPAEIAEDVIRCARAGACIAHLHARDVSGRPTQESAVFGEAIQRIREESDIVIQISLGSPGFTVEEAIAPLVLDPEMVAFPLRAFADAAIGSGVPESVEEMARAVHATRSITELDIVDQESRSGVDVVLESGLVRSPVAFGVNVQNPKVMREGIGHLLSLTEGLPEGHAWWLMKGGPCMPGLSALAAELGGHIRVGLEDSIHGFDGTAHDASNVTLVKHAVGLCEALGRPIATPADVRAFFRIGLAGASPDPIS